jgi:hypothetical protein
MATSGVRDEWTVGAEFNAPDVEVDGSELAAYRLARMSARLVQHLPPGAGFDPTSVWHTLAAWAPIDFVIGRALTALGQAPQLRGLGFDVRAIRGVQAFVALETSCTLGTAVRVLHSEPARDGSVEASLDVTLSYKRGLVARFSVDLRLRAA